MAMEQVRRRVEGEQGCVAADPEPVAIRHRVFRPAIDGEVVAARAGQLIGEIGFFAGEPRTASVVAARNSEVLEIDRAEFENLGDCKSAGAGISEMRIDDGPGYRVYFLQRGTTVVNLLVGGAEPTDEGHRVAEEARETGLGAQMAGKIKWKR